jgi:hypothetical protein
VNAICAGAIRTAGMVLAEQAAPDLARGLVDGHPMARMATEGEIAGAAPWRCCRDAGFVTGAPPYVDGGCVAGRRVRGVDPLRGGSRRVGSHARLVTTDTPPGPFEVPPDPRLVPGGTIGIF